MSKSVPSTEFEAAKQRGESRQAQILGRPPRIAPLDKKQFGDVIVQSTSHLRDEVACEKLPPIPLEYCPEMVATLLRHADVWERLASLSAIVQCANASVPPRARQLLIMRTMWLCGAPYQWGEHVERSKKAGLSTEDLERLKLDADVEGWSADDRALLAAADELHADSFISDATWSRLSARFDERQLIELVVLIGQFTSVAFLLNSTRMRLEPNNKGFLD